MRENFSENLNNEKELPVLKTERSEIAPEEKYETELFKETEPQYEYLLSQLLPEIKKHKYGMIIGDDASGRIPTLVISGFMKEIYKRDGNAEKFKYHLETKFFAAGHRGLSSMDDWEERKKLEGEVYKKIAAQLKKGRKHSWIPKKVLIVTEYISHGKTMSQLVKAVSDAGMPCDVAALQTIWKQGNKFYDMNHIGDTTHIAADNIFAGKYEEESEPKIYADRRASGVKKNKFRSDIYAEKIDDVTSSEEFRATRRDVNRLVKKMLNKLALDGAGEEE